MRRLGTQALSFAEDCVQDAFVAALDAWPRQGIPDNPFAWLLKTAHHRAIDRLRRHAMQSAMEPRVGEWMKMLMQSSFDRPIFDDELVLIILCCHPELSLEARLALTLKSVCGFNVEQISRALLIAPAAVAQRLVRAKSHIKAQSIEFTMPALPLLAERMPSVLKTIYLMFNEGYSTSSGDMLVRHELCIEALRLIELVTGDERTSLPEAHALAALLMFQHARHCARVTSDGTPLLLDQQDRTLWDKQLNTQGFRHLSASMNSKVLTSYHLEAGIASVHAAATSWEHTDWKQLVAYYESLHAMTPSPVVRVNQAVAIAMLDGPEKGVAILRLIESDKAMQNYLPYYMTLGELELRSNRRCQAREAFQRALTLAMSEPERKLLLTKLHKVFDA